MFLLVRLFPWRLGRSIIVLRPQTETDQTRRRPTNQDGSCGSGTHHALIRFGLVSVLYVWTKAIALVCLSQFWQSTWQQQRLWERKSEGEKSRGLFLARPPAPSARPGSSRQSLSSCGFSELRRHFLCGFFNSSTCHLAGSAIVPIPFSPCSFCRDESCHPLVISTFVAFVFGPTSEVHLVFYVPAFHA